MKKASCRCRASGTVLGQQLEVQQRLTQEAGRGGGLIAFHCRVGLAGTRKCTQYMHKVLVDEREDGSFVSAFVLCSGVVLSW